MARVATAVDVSEYSVAVDHFDVKRNEGKTFPLRFYLNSTYMDPHNCKIFFVLGGEGAANLGGMAPFVSERLAREHRAAVLHAEHRFYGKSVFSEQLELLTIEQALRDYADLLVHVTQSSSDKRPCETVAVGGSYPGNLAILFRMLYPWLIHGAYASSAPIKYLTGEAVETEYYDIVEATTRRSDPRCPEAVRGVLDAVMDMERKKLVDSLNLCVSETQFADLQTELVQAVRVHFANMNMAAYPLESSQLKNFCDNLTTQNTNETRIAAVFDAVLKNTKHENENCRDFARLAPANSGTVTCSDVTGCGLDQDGLHWDWQACTEHVMLIGSRDSMFPRLVGNLKRLENYCRSRFAISPSGFRLKDVLFPGGSVRQLATVTSNILFVNGQNDGWTAGCVRESLGTSLVVVEIADGAHHSEMGPDKPIDTQEMLSIRKKISSIVGEFFSKTRVEDEQMKEILVA